MEMVTALDVNGRRWYLSDVVTCADCVGEHRIAGFVATINPSPYAAAAVLADIGRDDAPCYHSTLLSQVTLVRRATPDEWPCAAGAYPFLKEANQ